MVIVAEENADKRGADDAGSNKAQPIHRIARKDEIGEEHQAKEP